MKLLHVVMLMFVVFSSFSQSLNLEWRNEVPHKQVIKQTWVSFPKKVPYKDTNGVWHFPITGTNGLNGPSLPTGYYTNKIYLTNELYGLYFTFPTNSNKTFILLSTTNLFNSKWNNMLGWSGKEYSGQTLRVHWMFKYRVYDPKNPNGILNGGFTQKTNLEYKPYISIPMFFKMIEDSN